eukprot:TRINITY_DN36609_c0_g1_i1.p1 TRINITY_DN36609_c0_g1~~TRINITY_DN36609_c0_g1_i1.p1  ORF type:complete len:346 (+),score=59.27 TRINITY_DN36609_c0_g1_i1:753-1790(+)
MACWRHLMPRALGASGTLAMGQRQRLARSVYSCLPQHSPCLASIDAPPGLGYCRSFSSSSSDDGEKDPYRTLGVDRNATQDEIKAAYRKQAMKWHPDRQPPDKREQAQRKFSAIANAYEILSDPVKRRQQDARGGNGFSGGFQAPGGGFQAPGGGFHPGAGSPGGFSHSQESAEKLFREVFGANVFEQMFGQMFNQGAPAQLSVGMDVKVQEDFAQVLAACRKCGIDSTNDAKRRRCLGKKGRIVKVDPKDQSVKLKVDGVGDVWFGSEAVRPPGGGIRPGGGFPSFNLGNFGGAGFGGMSSGGVQEIRQEIVTTPDGKRVLRVTQRIRMPDGSVREDVSESQMQ